MTTPSSLAPSSRQYDSYTVCSLVSSRSHPIFVPDVRIKECRLLSTTITRPVALCPPYLLPISRREPSRSGAGLRRYVCSIPSSSTTFYMKPFPQVYITGPEKSDNAILCVFDIFGFVIRSLLLPHGAILIVTFPKIFMCSTASNLKHNLAQTSSPPASIPVSSCLTSFTRIHLFLCPFFRRRPTTLSRRSRTSSAPRRTRRTRWQRLTRQAKR